MCTECVCVWGGGGGRVVTQVCVHVNVRKIEYIQIPYASRVG